jgi:hypothetical protein
MLKTGEADIGHLMVGVEAATIKTDPRLRLAQVIPSMMDFALRIEPYPHDPGAGCFLGGEGRR